MIRLFCICGKHLRARDEASLRHAVCPICGCPVGQSSAGSDETVSGKKPLTLQNGPLQGMGYLVVPTWEEGSANPKDIPRYKVVTIEESTQAATYPFLHDDPAPITENPSHSQRKKRKRKRRRSGKLNTSLQETLLLPFHCWRSIVSLAFLTVFFLIIARSIMVLSEPTSATIKFVTALLVVLGSGAYCCGCWMVVFTTTVRGEDSVVLWSKPDRYEAFVHMLRSLVCFLAGPALILGVACSFWLNSGELKLVDKLILAELILAALMYWLFSLLAVTADNSLASVTPAGIAGLLQRLGWRTSLITAAAVLFGMLLIFGLGGYSILTMSTNDWSWLLLLMSCLSAQVFLCLLSRWLGVQFFLTDHRSHTIQSKQTATV